MIGLLTPKSSCARKKSLSESGAGPRSVLFAEMRPPPTQTLLSLSHSRDVARDRRCENLPAVCVYLPPARKCAVDRVECEWLQDLRHSLNLGGGERDQIRVRPHKADVPAWDDLEDVAREQYAATFAPVCPVQDGTAVEVSSQPNQREARPNWLGVPLPELHRGVRPHHPLTISRVQVDRYSPERTAPLHHRGVVVRVGDRDRRDAAQALQQIDCGVVD